MISIQKIIDIDRRWVYLLAVLVRLGLILYGEYQDANFEVKYTDVDYRVYSDAATHMYYGRSPYKRATYRYPPTLAALLIPNVAAKNFGKVLFCALDLVCAELLVAITVLCGAAQPGLAGNRKLSYVRLFWLFNPITLGISSRGNAESLSLALVLAGMYYVLSARPVRAGVALAIAIHLRVYPVIYAPAFVLFLSNGWRHLLNSRSVAYVTALGATLLALSGVCWSLYGGEFLHNAYLYHISRKDIRHNFSPYFYWLYLSDLSATSALLTVVAFVPQLVALIVIVLCAFRRLAVCLFLQTVVLVSFNKVSTSQYFLWYLIFVPVVASQARLPATRLALLGVGWLFGQAVWLFFAYLLEFRGLNTYLWLHLAGLLHLSLTTVIATNLVRLIKLS